MADWFESRFRDGVDEARLDPAFVTRVRALVVEEWQAEDWATRSDGTEQDPSEEYIVMLETEDRKTDEEPAPPATRRRWSLVAAAAAVLLVVLAGALAADDDERELDTADGVVDEGQGAPAGTVPDVMTLPGFEPLTPGTYAIDPDGDEATPLKILFDVPGDGWSSWLGAVKFANEAHVALSITTVDNLVRDGCTDHRPADPAVGPTVDDLAAALSRLAPFELTSAPTAVDVLGHPGVHLQLRVPDLPTAPEERNSDSSFVGCTDGELHSWIGVNNDGSFYGYNGEPGRVEDYWILDVDGTRLALITTTAASSPAQDVRELEEMLDSVRLAG